MLGRVEFVPGGRGEVARGELYGVPVLRARVDPGRWSGAWQMRRAGRRLREWGAVRTLLPHGFADEKWLAEMGLLRVDCSAFLGAQAPELTMEVLRRREVDPGRACVVLRGERVDGRMLRAAGLLSRQVRHLAVDAPWGGEELGRWLRREFGVAVLPPGQGGDVALCFQPGPQGPEGARLELYGNRPGLDGVKLCAPGLEEEDREDLEMLSALWARGRLTQDGLKFT